MNLVNRNLSVIEKCADVVNSALRRQVILRQVILAKAFSGALLN